MQCLLTTFSVVNGTIIIVLIIAEYSKYFLYYCHNVYCIFLSLFSPLMDLVTFMLKPNSISKFGTVAISFMILCVLTNQHKLESFC